MTDISKTIQTIIENSPTNVSSLESHKTIKSINQLLSAFFPNEMRKQMDQAEKDLSNILPLLPYMEEKYMQVVKCRRVLTDFCVELENLVPRTRVALLLYHIPTQMLSIGASPSVPLGFFEAVAGFSLQDIKKHFKLSAEDVNSIREGMIDIPNSILPQAFKDNFAKYNIASSWRFPFLYTGEVIALFTFYSSDPHRVIHQKEQQLLKQQVVAYHKELKQLADNVAQDNPAFLKYTFQPKE